MKAHCFYMLIVLTTLSSCLKNEKFKQEYKGFTPVTNFDNWQISSAAAEGMDSVLLEEAYRLLYSDERFLMARSLLVFRNGKLIAEAYPHNDADINEIENIQSCTKSVTSILTGIAIKDGYINSLDERLYDIYPQLFDRDTMKRNITIGHALAMRTGLSFNNDENTQVLFATKQNSVQYVLQQNLLYKPGVVMHYNDGAPHLVSKAIEVKTGKPLSSYTSEKLFGPLGISNWKWESAKDGTTFGAFSLYLKPRDFGKIGQLLLQNGIWNNQQVIDSVYLAQATNTQVSANFSGNPYGYYFWILPATGSYFASGHGGQFLLVNPQKKLVVVYTAWPYTNEMFFDEGNELMDLIAASCN